LGPEGSGGLDILHTMILIFLHLLRLLLSLTEKPLEWCRKKRLAAARAIGGLKWGKK